MFKLFHKKTKSEALKTPIVQQKLSVLKTDEIFVFNFFKSNHYSKNPLYLDKNDSKFDIFILYWYKKGNESLSDKQLTHYGIAYKQNGKFFDISLNTEIPQEKITRNIFVKQDILRDKDYIYKIDCSFNDKNELYNMYTIEMNSANELNCDYSLFKPSYYNPHEEEREPAVYLEPDRPQIYSANNACYPMYTRDCICSLIRANETQQYTFLVKNSLVHDYKDQIKLEFFMTKSDLEKCLARINELVNVQDRHYNMRVMKEQEQKQQSKADFEKYLEQEQKYSELKKSIITNKEQEREM